MQVAKNKQNNDSLLNSFKYAECFISNENHTRGIRGTKKMLMATNKPHILKVMWCIMSLMLQLFHLWMPVRNREKVKRARRRTCLCTGAWDYGALLSSQFNRTWNRGENSSTNLLCARNISKDRSTVTGPTEPPLWWLRSGWWGPSQLRRKTDNNKLRNIMVGFGLCFLS